MRTRVPALGAEGWFTEEGGAALIAARCTTCGTLEFPARRYCCPNPACRGQEFTDARLAQTGTVWSYTVLRYQPPPPFVPPSDPYEPAALLAVEVDDSGLVILGQAVAGLSADDLSVGARVKLVIDTLMGEGDTDYIIWKWALAEVLA
jgi:uncharacterized OB-fold protein